MKTRMAFVSNSSSSSFILGFDKDPKSVEDLMKIMFPNMKECDIVLKSEYVNVQWTVKEVCEDLYAQMNSEEDIEELRTFIGESGFCLHGKFYHFHNYEEQFKELREEERAFYNEIRNNFGDIYIWDKKYDIREEIKKYRKLSAEIYRKITNKQNEIIKMMVDSQWDEIKRMFDKKTIYIVEYEDHSDFGAAMEHGGLLQRILPCLQVNHH